MYKARIRFAFRLLIDQSSTVLWHQYVFEDTYREYLMQHQLFHSKENPKLTFRELLRENPKSEQLHYLVGIAANSYIQQLKGKIHRVSDVLGNNFLSFTNYKLDIIDTNIQDSSKHKIGITFYSPMLTLVDMVNDCYLVSEDITSKNGFETFMFPVQPNLSICYFEHPENSMV